MSGDALPDAVLTETDGPVAVVTINRPAARNAVNGAVAAGLAAALDDLEAREDIRVIVLTGAGGTFCAGMDLKGFLAGENPQAGGRGFAGIVERPPAKPVIAAVEGYALAGGFEVALSCDLIVASEGAGFRPAGSDPGPGRGGRRPAPAAPPHPLPPGHGSRADRGAHPRRAAAPGRPDQPAGAGRAGPGRGHRPGPQAQRERAARPGRHQAGHRGVRRLAGRPSSSPGRTRSPRRSSARPTPWRARPRSPRSGPQSGVASEVAADSRGRQTARQAGGLPGLAPAARVRPLRSGRRGPAHTSGSPPDSLVGDIDVRNRRLPGSGPGGRPGPELGAYRHRADHPPGTGRRGVLQRPRRGPGLPAAGDHRPVPGRAPADAVRRRPLLDGLQRRDLQLRRARPGAPPAGGDAADHLGLRGAAGDVRAAGQGRGAPAARHVRVRDLGHLDPGAVLRPGPVRHQALLLHRGRGPRA